MLHKVDAGLSDLANILGVPTTYIGLNNTLTLGLGSRGRGGRNPALAHYEPDTKLINLTRGKGAGTLAHEWFHALDHQADNKLSQALVDGVDRKTVRLEFRSVDLDRLEGRGGQRQYYGTTKEIGARAFEDQVYRRLTSKGYSNEYLVERVDPGQWERRHKGIRGEEYPYPLPNEYDAIDEAMDKVLARAVEPIAPTYPRFALDDVPGETDAEREARIAKTGENLNAARYDEFRNRQTERDRLRDNAQLQDVLVGIEHSL